MPTPAKRHLRIATRQSQLAQVQARSVGDMLQRKHPGVTYELLFVTTTGDKFMGNLAKVGGKEAFVKEIEEALLDGRADLAVHSMKDVPTVLPDGLTIDAVMSRDDFRDVAICRPGEEFSALPEGAKIGTSSVRRGALLQAAFPNLTIVPVRGNVQTRLEKLKQGTVDALILAKAGLDRLDLAARISVVFEPDMLCPALAQGAVGVECRIDDAELNALLAAVEDKETRLCVNTERLFLKLLGGSCHTPIAGYVQVTQGGNLRLIGLVASLDGQTVLRTRHKMPAEEWQELARLAADDVLAQGAGAIIKEAALATLAADY